jgi:predicted nucleotidyltransferase
MIDIEEEYLNELRRIFREHVPECEVRVFGSRVSGSARRFSDVDLLLVGPEKLDWRRIESLKDALSASDLPMIVDVIDWHAISEDFKNAIQDKTELLLTPTDNSDTAKK